MEPTREPTPPTGRRLPYVPALDGLRAVCLVAVLVYHGGFTWARGGFLGVSTFFTLSGFLITALLLVEVRDSGRVDLGRFWAARARRLLPAALVTLVLVLAFARFGASSTDLVGLRQDLWATFGLAINWRLAVEGATYGNAAEASPFQHMWSLAVEEQFYLVLPLACLGGAALARRLGRPLRVVLGWSAAALAVASTIALAASVGDDVSFAYYATHTRAAELLVGVVLACVVHHLVGWRHRRVVPIVGLLSVAGMTAAWAVVAQTGQGLYTGGMALYSLASAGTIAACLTPGPVRSVLQQRPLRALGRVSYGAYLYHWPIFCWLREDTTGLEQVPLFLVRVSLTIALASLSYIYVEMPIRRGRRLPRIPRTAFAGLAALVVASAFAVPLRTVDTGPSGVEVLSGERVASAGGAPVPVSAVQPVAPEIPPVERLLLVGDSVPLQLAPYVAEALPQVEVRFVGETGTGILTDQGAVVSHLDATVAEFDPDVVVVHYVGTYLRHTSGTQPYLLPDGTPVDEGSEDMFRAWRDRSEAVVDVARTRGAEVIWALIPQIHHDWWFSYLRDSVGRLNDIYRSLGVPVLDWYGLTSGPDGDFALDLPGPAGQPPEPARNVDGLHFTAFGNRLLAASVAEQVAEWPGRSEVAAVGVEVAAAG